MTRIKFETGQIVEFDGQPTQADIDEVAASFKSKEPQSRSFFRPGELGDQLAKDVKEPFKNYTDPLRTAVQREKEAVGFGEKAEMAGRTVLTGLGQGPQAGIGAAFNIGTTLLSAIVPDWLEDPIREIAGEKTDKWIEDFATSNYGINVLEGARGVEEFIGGMKPKNQQAVKDVFATALTAADLYSAGTTSGVSRTAGKKVISKGEDIIEGTVRDKKIGAREKLGNLIIDDSTPTKRAALAGRTTEGGFFTGRNIALTKNENKIIDELLNIKGVDPNKTALYNKNIIDNEIGREADNLVKQVEADNFIFPKKELNKKLDDVLTALKKEDTDVIGDAEKLADRIFSKIKVFVEAEDGTGAGALRARKAYDKWVKTKKPKAFDKQDAFATINREARATLNDFLASKAPTAPVKQSLLRQSRLINVAETLATKSSKEGATGFIRLIDKASNVLGTKNKVVQLFAAALGIGGLGAASTFAPAAAGALGLGVAGVASRKLLTSPASKKKFGKVLIEIGKQLPKADNATAIMLIEIQEEIKDIFREETEE